MMRRLFATTVTLLILLGAAPAAFADNPKLLMRTGKGDVTLELYPDQAPETVKNFLAYVEAGFYTGTIFHRVIEGFMIQGGGFDQAMRKKTTRAPIKNEADNGLKNRRGTIWPVPLSPTRLPPSSSSTIRTTPFWITNPRTAGVGATLSSAR